MVSGESRKINVFLRNSKENINLDLLGPHFRREYNQTTYKIPRVIIVKRGTRKASTVLVRNLHNISSSLLRDVFKQCVRRDDEFMWNPKADLSTFRDGIMKCFIVKRKKISDFMFARMINVIKLMLIQLQM